MKKGKMNKKNLIFVGGFVIALALMVFVFAATVITAPAKHGNYTGTMNFSITTGINISGTGLPFNVTIYYNENGGAVDGSSSLLTTIFNSSIKVENFNASVSITGLTDGKYYNFSAYADNGTDQEWSPAISNVTIDNTGPAVTGFANSVNNGNYSGAIVLNVSVVDATMSAGTVYFNITNSSGQQHNYTQAYSPGSGRYNISINTVGFVDGKYNVTVYSNDTLGNTNNTEYIQITIDNTVPVVTSFANTVNGGNYSGVIVLNISVTDATSGVKTVYFNITNSSGQQHNYTQAYSPGSGRYNISINTTGFVDGKYNVTVYSNDTAGTTNNTEYIQITIDNAVPTATYTCNPPSVSVGDSSISCTCVPSDVTSGIVAASTVFTVNPSTTDPGINKEVSCSFVDEAGNTGTKIATYTVVQSGTGSTGGGGGSTSPQTWTKTLKVVDEQFESDSGYTRKLARNERLQMVVEGENHFVGVISMTSTTVVIEVSSSPQQATFNIGNSKKFDVLNDGFYDIMVTLNSIASNRADITTTLIHEAVPQPPAESVAESPEEETIGDSEEDTSSVESGTNFAWGWVVLIVIFIIVGIVAFEKNKEGKIKKRKKKK